MSNPKCKCYAPGYESDSNRPHLGARPVLDGRGGWEITIDYGSQTYQVPCSDARLVEEVTGKLRAIQENYT